MSRIITAPEEIDWWNWIGMRSLFLAGSIEQGLAEEWQDKVIAAIRDMNIVILNPRRKAWDASWEQSIHHKEFKQQVVWEQTALLDQSDYALFYFAPNTKAPITLMELGLVATKQSIKKIVVCPDGFWRKGNVDILCEKCGLHVYPSLDEGINVIRNTIPCKVEATANGPHGFIGK